VFAGMFAGDITIDNNIIIIKMAVILKASKLDFLISDLDNSTFFLL
jgi:hypothetical protein